MIHPASAKNKAQYSFARPQKSSLMPLEAEKTNIRCSLGCILNEMMPLQWPWNAGFPQFAGSLVLINQLTF